MNFSGKALPITRDGLNAALGLLGFSANQAAPLWAVFAVETGDLTQGFGFDTQRRPQILFERHIFSKNTNHQFDTSNPDISGPPGGYGTYSAQYGRLQKALDLCSSNGLSAELALSSTSWGIGQVMGFNHTAAGYGDAKSMVDAMVQSEDAQLMGAVRFMVAQKLAAALQKHDWDGFASIYNGPNYEANQYAQKLETNYARISSGSMPDMEVRTAQAALLVLQFRVGKIDGVMGPATHTALKSFQIANGLSASAELDSDTYAKLYRVAFQVSS